MWRRQDGLIKTIRTVAVLMIGLLSAQSLCAEVREYRQEMGVQGGLGYYIGDATQHSFNHIREAYGLQWRYKFDPRWALQIKGQGQRIAFPVADATQTNQLINVDIVGEFNFFRFGQRQYDDRVKQITPYIFLGLGLSGYQGVREVEIVPAQTDAEGNVVAEAVMEKQTDQARASVYIPFGLGLKWKFAERWGLQVAWQQNLYFADGLENVVPYMNPNDLNGSNILWNDLTSSLTIGIVFEFSKTEKVCRTCW